MPERYEVERVPAHCVQEGDTVIVQAVDATVRKVEKYEGTPDRQLHFVDRLVPVKALDNEPMLRVVAARGGTEDELDRMAEVAFEGNEREKVLERRVDELREALEFYAEKDHWLGRTGVVGHLASEIERDRGERARAALAARAASTPEEET